MDAVIRGATPNDAADIASVQVRAWQAAYRGIMPDDYLDGLEPDQRESMWRGLLEADDPDRQILVATVADQVIGFAAFGPARSGEPTTGELYALNVDPAAWAAGHGRRLLHQATEWLAAARFADAVLFVAAENGRARRLYESEQWTTDGNEVTGDVLGAAVREVRYRRRLGS